MPWGRTRWRTDYPVVGTGSYTWTPGLESGYLEYSGSNFTYSYYMADTVEKRRQPRDTRPYPNHPMNQIIMQARPINGSISWVDWNNVTELLHRSFDPASIDVLHSPYPPPEVVGPLAMQAFQEFATQVPTDVSIGNFLWELRDIKGLIPKIQGSLLRTANGTFLGYQFGIKPFLKDLRKLSGLLESVRKRLEFLRRSRGKLTRINFFRPDVYVHPNLGVRVDPAPDSLGLDHQWVLTNYRADFRAQGFLFHTLKGLDDSLAFLKAASAALGLNNPAAIVWEAIPYSFVVDWFFNIQRVVDQWDLAPFEGAWEVTNATSSISSFSLIDAYVWPRRAFGNSWMHIYRIRRKAKKREVGLPVPRASLGTLSDQQQVLLGSLIFQRLKT